VAELIIILVALGIIVIVAWPALRTRTRSSGPEDQPAPTDRGTIPPRRPDEPIPGSQTDRERKGRP
jgi:hypothetical protein